MNWNYVAGGINARKLKTHDEILIQSFQNGTALRRVALRVERNEKVGGPRPRSRHYSIHQSISSPEEQVGESI